MIGGPHRLTTGGARALERLQGLGCSGNGSGGETCHNRYLHESFYAWYRYPTRSLAQFATLVFFSTRRTVSSETASTNWSATKRSANNCIVQCTRPAGGVLQARATKKASCLPSNLWIAPGR